MKKLIFTDKKEVLMLEQESIVKIFENMKHV